ncbi:hypothetical protein DFP73DRAFT_614698 [Morchella snyderi]|nr:hypothetical protein DFP73DRAFT_614698 [Morchella snyderi]
MLFASRTFSVTALLCALRMKDAVDQGSKEPPDFTQDHEINHLNIQALIVKLCCSLIEVHGGSSYNFVYLVYFSVKEYLLERIRSEALYRGDPSGRNNDTPYIFDPRNGDDILYEIQGLMFQKSLLLEPWFGERFKQDVLRTPEVLSAGDLADMVHDVTLSPAEVAAMLKLPDLTISLFLDGETPQRVLSYAAGFGGVVTVRTLIQRGDFDVNWAADGYPWMPLSAAFEPWGTDDIIEALLERKAWTSMHLSTIREK